VRVNGRLSELRPSSRRRCTSGAGVGSGGGTSDLRSLSFFPGRRRIHGGGGRGGVVVVVASPMACGGGSLRVVCGHLCDVVMWREAAVVVARGGGGRRRRGTPLHHVRMVRFNSLPSLPNFWSSDLVLVN
jgi:hypothetical protein